tara:strand:- start:871 stop:1536 length:666 start_codon:yes stop_codon:yes gene_type:complete
LVNKNKIICLIPARSGSTRVKNKNIAKIKNKPMIHYALDAALKSQLIEKTFIATNSKKIKDSIKNFKQNKIKIIKRSKKSETQYAATEILLDEFCKNYESDIIILLQITNIFITSKILDQAIKKFISSNVDCLVSVINFANFIWKKDKKIIKPFNYNPKKRPRSQEFNDFVMENGSFYIFRRKKYLKYKNRMHGKITFFEMPKKSFFDIDTKEDLKIVRSL